MQSKLLRASLARAKRQERCCHAVHCKDFSGTDLIPRHHDSSLEAARPIRSARHAHHLWPLQIPSKIESAIDTHRYRHTPTV